jgi:hypothetical protein
MAALLLLGLPPRCVSARWEIVMRRTTSRQATKPNFRASWTF